MPTLPSKERLAAEITFPEQWRVAIDGRLVGVHMPDGQIVVCLTSESATVIDAESGKVLRRAAFKAIAWVPCADAHYVLGNAEGQIFRFAYETGKLHRLGMKLDPVDCQGLRLYDNGEAIIGACDSGRIFRLNGAGEPAWVTRNAGGRIHDARVVGKALVAAGGRYLIIIDGSTGKAVAAHDVGSEIAGLDRLNETCVVATTVLGSVLYCSFE